MKVISLNVNNFGGVCPKDWKNVRHWRNANRYVIEENVRRTVYFTTDYDVIFLHEVDTNCESWDLLVTLMEKAHFRLKLPNGTAEQEIGRDYSITCAFVREGTSWKRTDNNFSQDTARFRNVELTADGITLLGVHALYKDPKASEKERGRAEAYWSAMTDRFRRQKTSILLIGDLNVYDPGTEQRQLFDPLLRSGACDLWTAQGDADNVPTFLSGKRIDYALGNEAFIKHSPHVIIHQSVIRFGISDHAAVSVVWQSPKGSVQNHKE